SGEPVFRNRSRQQAIRLPFEVEVNSPRKRVIANQNLEPVEFGIEQNKAGMSRAQLAQGVVIALRPARHARQLANQNPPRDPVIPNHSKISVAEMWGGQSWLPAFQVALAVAIRSGRIESMNRSS